RAGNRAVQQVGPDHVGKSPVLEVRTLDFGAEQDLAIQSPDAMPPLDALNRRPAVVPFVEHARTPEDRGSYCPTPRPEGLGLARVLLVMVVVEKVAVLGNQAGAGWPVVI